MEGIGKVLGEAMIVMCLITLAIFWGGCELIDFIFIDDVIKTKTLIVPEIEIKVKDNVIDTLYIYRKP